MIHLLIALFGSGSPFGEAQFGLETAGLGVCLDLTVYDSELIGSSDFVLFEGKSYYLP